ncbi:uncharacterized protein LOC127704118 isoform X2 [Mytilus californianus]|uniref:uncharacterized protein LOC127704118 isoform X2 n=1 Tax=Mytilus californianus TaxID=6549 RepID=UPI002246603F|nr:uncharacterized protein LOC127704118 isoform X2 [Mytilus californianus]
MYTKHMNTHSMKWKVILLTVVHCVSCNCPPPAMNTSYATQKCPNDPRSYHCLWDGLNDAFIEICVSPEYYTPGSYVVFQKALNAKRCPVSRYQPFAYWTNDENRCIYQNSNCTAEGQHLLSRSGTTTADITCRCDYRKGYSYLIRPNDPCNCKPNEEDCSCYIKFCNEDHALSPDYNCEVIKSDVIRQYQCPRLIRSSEDDTVHRNHTDVELTSNSYKKNIIRQPIDRFLVGIVLLGAIIVMIATFSVWFGVLVFAHEEKKSDLSQLIDTTTIQCVMDTEAFKKAKIAFENNSILIIKGEHGSGKTSLAMQLLTMYRKNNYTVIVLDNTNVHLLNAIKDVLVKYVILLEEWFDACAIEKIWPQSIINALKNIQMSSKCKAIVTVNSATNTDCEKLKSAGIWTESNIVNLDLDDSFSREDRESILLFHLDLNKRNLNKIEIKKIITAQTVGAFPIQCSAFCSTNSYFELGSRFFRLPQQGLIDKINELRTNGMNNITDRVKYCTLVYILINPDNGLQFNHIDTKKINGICSYVFKQKCSEESLIKSACQSMRLLYLKCNESGDYFLRPVIYQAVLLSHAYIDFECLKLILKTCDLEAIIGVLRPPTYVKLNEEETVLIVDKDKLDGFDIIAKRFAEACLHSEQTSELICEYIESYRFSTVLQKTMTHLDTHLNNLTTENRVKLMILVTKRLTLNCSSLELISYTPTNFALAWSIIVFIISDKMQLLSEIDEGFLAKGNHSSLVGILKTVVDEHGNTILHYCILWWYNRKNPLIMRISKALRQSPSNCFSLSGKNSILSRNKEVNMSALEFAAYFGNYEAVSDFVFYIAKWNRIGSKDISSLIEFAENGKANNIIQNYGSSEFVNNDVCGPISVNEHFSYDKTIKQLQSIRKDIK